MKKPLMKKTFGGRRAGAVGKRARSDEETVDEETFGGVGMGAVGGSMHVLMCWDWTLPGVGLASGSPRSSILFWLPPLEDDAYREYLHAPILRGAWVPPHEDDACHDEHNGGGGGGGGGGQPCAWRRRWW